MNRIAIISDIHGNLPALEAVLIDIKKRNISQIYCLGDLVGYYCFHNEVVETIKNNAIPSLLGNHDYALINNFGIIERSKTCTKILQWQLENIDEMNLRFLQTLKPSFEFEFSNKKIKLVHGGLIDNLDEYSFSIDEEYLKINNFEHDVLITGHTHLIGLKKFYNGKMWVNPGSVGQPRDFNNKASYAILDDELNVEFIRVLYDFDKTIESMKTLGFDDYISEGLRNGKKIGS
jgi:putative phosphoesterase